MQRVCVFTGSSPGARGEYATAAAALGRELCRRGLGLVYGGANVGLMGVLADAVLAEGGEVIGVIPAPLVEYEVAHAGLSDLRVTGSMHERKATMAELSDGFVALPGGLGTLEEFFEVLTWAQLGFHGKPCGLLNAGGYYDGLLGFLGHCVAERFVKPVHRDLVLVADAPAPLLDRMAAHRAPADGKWLDRKRT